MLFFISFASNGQITNVTGRSPKVYYLLPITTVDSVLTKDANGYLGFINKSELTPTLTTGSYNPTITSVTNITATTSYSTTKYSRLGDIITVFGKFIADPTSTGATEIDISLPISSDITGDDDVAGVASCATTTGEVLTILGDATNNRARVMWTATDTSSRTFFFIFHYKYTAP